MAFKNGDGLCVSQEWFGVTVFRNLANWYSSSTCLTTAMVASILTDAGLNPSCIVGAELIRPSGSHRPASGWAGTGELMVVESCEYQQNFLAFHPRYAAILNIEPDHFDFCFLA